VTSQHSGQNRLASVDQARNSFLLLAERRLWEHGVANNRGKTGR